EPRMNRLYAVESTPGLTGAAADHRLPLRARDMERLARVLAARLGCDVAADDSSTPAVPAAWLDVLVPDLQQHLEASLVVPGEGQPATVHALAHAINRQLKNVGHTVEYLAPVEAQPVDQTASLADLVEQMRQKEVKVLVMLGGNPVYNTPQELDFAGALEQVRLRLHLSEYFD